MRSQLLGMGLAATMVFAVAPVRAELLKPFVLAREASGDMAQTAAGVQAALKARGFEVVGSYSPYADATVICATNAELKAAAAQATNGGFGVAQRVAVTAVNGKLQVSYVNPAYIGTAYGLGELTQTAAALQAALGHEREFGSNGIDAERLAPGKYHYAIGMPYFRDVDVLARHADHKSAVATVEQNLAAGKGGTRKIYRVDLPGKDVSVFGVGIVTGDGIDAGARDTDKEIMDIIDFQSPRSTAYLPYELMVDGERVIALRGRYRIAVNFPDLSMAGKHGFTKIMSAPGGIKDALSAVAKP